jgi:thioredoxin-like negative regulator of GroEL
MTNIRFVLFRDDRSASGDAAAVVRGSIRSRTGHYSLTEIDVRDHPTLAEQYNVRTTPTTLLMKNGDIVDRIVGTPTPSLVHTLLDMRTASAHGGDDGRLAARPTQDNRSRERGGSRSFACS